MEEKVNLVENSEGIQQPLIVADLIEDESNTKLEVITGTSIAKFLFSAFTEIYMKYSKHDKKFPSFEGFNIDTVDITEGYISYHIVAFDKKFTLKTTKIVDEYKKAFDDAKNNGTTQFRYVIVDNMVSLCVSFENTKETVCEIVPLIIPYAFIESSIGVIGPANTENFKDLHDTIFGFNLIMNASCNGETKCMDSDTYDYNTGYDIAKMKALKEKVQLDIGNYMTCVAEYDKQIKKYQKLLSNSKRTLRRCKRSDKRLTSKIKEYFK